MLAGSNSARLASSVLALLFILPLAAVLWLAVSGQSDTLSHLSATVLPNYIGNALLLMLGSGALALLLGVSSAWLITLYDFPARRLFEWAMLLPLALPAYLLAMVYSEWLSPAGLLASWQVPLHSVAGACVLFALSLYPYIYMLARIAFRQQCVTLYEAAAMLGVPRRAWWWRVGMPAARPALAIGTALICMEVLADFGTVSLLGVPSFTTGIYRVWYGMGDLTAAAQLSAYLLCFVLALMLWERTARRNANYASIHRARGRLERISLSGLAAWRATIICALPVLFGFALPVLQWVSWALTNQQGGWDASLLHAFVTSLTIALGVVLVVLSAAKYFAYQLRSHPERSWLIRLAASGYAIPGSVIALGVFLPLVALDKWLALNIGTTSLLFSGTIIAVIMACSVRFLALALAQYESALGTIDRTMDDAATLLGANIPRIRREIHAPFLHPAMWMAGVLILCDVVKELPATILLRPFNQDTLAVRTFELASDGRIYQAAPSALAMILLSVLAVLCMARLQHPERTQIMRSSHFTHSSARATT